MPAEVELAVAVSLRPSQEPPPFNGVRLVEPYASLQGGPLLMQHYGCDLRAWEGSGVWAQLAIEGCRPPEDAWTALRNAEQRDFWLTSSQTDTPFLMLTLDPGVDTQMSALLHSYGVLDPFMSYWHWATALHQPFYRERSFNMGPEARLRRPLYVDVGAGLGFFGLNAISLGFRTHFVGLNHLLSRAIQLSLRVNGWQQHARLFKPMPVGVSTPDMYEDGSVVPEDELPISLEELTGGETVALMRLDLDSGEEASVMIAAHGLLRTRRIHRIVMNVYGSAQLLSMLRLLQEEVGYELFEVVDDRNEQWRVWDLGGYAFGRSYGGEESAAGGGTRPLGDLGAFARRLGREEHGREIICMLPDGLANVPVGEEAYWKGFVDEGDTAEAYPPRRTPALKVPEWRQLGG